METQRGVWLLTVLLLAVLNSAVAEDKLSYFMAGGNIVFRPRSVPEPITSILWKYNSNLLAEWTKGEDVVYYSTFKGRTALTLTSGLLEIKNMSEADMGLYAVEINNRVRSPRYDAKAIKEVPQPAVWVQPVACTNALDSCKLTCDGNTKEAEPVTYSWKMGEEEWKESTKNVDFTKTETARVKTFSCRMKNPVSEKESEPKDNPFFQEEKPDGPGVGVGVGVGVAFGLLVLIVGGAVIWKKDSIREWISNLGGGNTNDSVTLTRNGQAASSEGEPLSPKPKSEPTELPKSDSELPKSDSELPKSDSEPPKSDSEPPKSDSEPPKSDSEPPEPNPTPDASGSV